MNNNDYIIQNINEGRQYIIKKDGKYILYVNRLTSEQIKEIKNLQQKSIKQEEIDKINTQKKDDNFLLYIFICFIFTMFIFLAFSTSR